ncbi:MAG: deaminase [Nanoarchaeota archaeon]
MGNLISGQDAVFMMEALVEAEAAAARGDYGIGAVVVHDGKIISRAGNRIISSGGFQWQHAENLALRQIESTNHFKSPLVRELSVYTTLGPCPQCWGHMMVNGVGRVVYGAGDEMSTQNYETSVPSIFQPKKPAIVEFGGDLGVRCLDIFLRSAAAIDAKLGYERQA